MKTKLANSQNIKLNDLTENRRLLSLSGKQVWLIFYPTGATPSANRHILTLSAKASSAPGLSLQIVCVFRTCSKASVEKLGIQNESVTLIEDDSGDLFEAFNFINDEPILRSSKIKFFLRRILGIRIKKTQRPLHFLVAEDGVIEKIFRGLHFSDHLGWGEVRKFVEFRNFGVWPQNQTD